MMEATCATCPFWDAAPDDRGGRNEQRCRVRSPAAMTVPRRDSSQNRDAVWPWTECDDWCGEHPARQRDRLAAMAMQGCLAAGHGADPVFCYRLADSMLAARGEG